MTPRLTTLRTMTQYGLARLRVLCATRTLRPALLVSSLLALTVIGTSAAWRARTSSDELPPVEATFAVSPLAELVPPSPAASTPHEATTVASAAPVTPSTETSTVVFTESAETHGPSTTATSGGEPAQRAARQPERAPRHDTATRERECTGSERRHASGRMARDTNVNARPPRPAPRAPVPAIPRVQVVSVSSTAVLIQHDGHRQIIRRGARLNGWTLTRLAPIGVTLRRAQQHAFLPLSFAARVGNIR